MTSAIQFTIPLSLTPDGQLGRTDGHAHTLDQRTFLTLFVRAWQHVVTDDTYGEPEFALLWDENLGAAMAEDLEQVKELYAESVDAALHALAIGVPEGDRLDWRGVLTDAIEASFPLLALIGLEASTDELSADYGAWMEGQGLQLRCAHEAQTAGVDLDGKELSPAQLYWLAVFSALWDAATDREDAERAIDQRAHDETLS